jgi:uncharacterized protein (DUF2267 family)
VKMEDFLEAIRESLGLASRREADKVVRVVVATLKSSLPEDKARTISSALPEELSEGWDEVQPLQTGIIDQGEMYLEYEEGRPEREDRPTITQG